ncbi:hypothetical protein GFC30_2292 [Anoxybacillus amylolyticus]|uniref:Transposase n=1 Tax=Anoxybacteroides amylolyticum TaxID=294699 RepID=A0A160F3H3_9BACL|nr:hypothetical protein GFC30_2292 [Anoxybacillus amylolyticus]
MSIQKTGRRSEPLKVDMYKSGKRCPYRRPEGADEHVKKQRTYKSYSPELKMEAVQRALAGESVKVIAHHLEITDPDYIYKLGYISSFSSYRSLLRIPWGCQVLSLTVSRGSETLGKRREKERNQSFTTMIPSR